jgi:PPE-repeat protein
VFNQTGWFWLSGKALCNDTDFQIGSMPGPRKGAVSWQHGNKLFIFGGFGFSNNSEKPGKPFVL